MSVTHQITAKHQRVFLWLFVASMVVGMAVPLIGQRIAPSPNMSMSVSQIAALYQQYAVPYRFMFMVSMLCGGFYFGFTAVISAQLRRIEGSVGRVLNYTQLSAGAANGVLLLLPSLLFTAAAFRPDRNPQITVALHDLANIIVLMPIASFSVQQFAIALAIYADNGTRPVFPRWVGHVNLWTAIAYIPAFMMTFAKTGTWSFDGWGAFYVPVIAFLLWNLVMIVMLFKAIGQEAEEGAALQVRTA
jgi:hypothetical protein